MGNFISTTLTWKAIQPQASRSTKVQILPETNHNLIILHWIIDQWFQFHNQIVLPEIRKVIGWTNELEVSDLEDFLHIPLFDNQDPEHENERGFVSRLQIKEIHALLQQDSIIERRFRSIDQRLKVEEVPGKPEEGKKYSLLFFQKPHDVFPVGTLYVLRQQEAADHNAPGYKLSSHCKIYNIHYTMLHFQALKKSNDARRSAIDLLNLIQEYIQFIIEWSNIGISMFANDFWGTVSSSRQWEELLFRDRRQYIAKMRALMYIQNLDAYLCKQWINTKLLRVQTKQIFKEIQQTIIHKDVYESKDYNIKAIGNSNETNDEGQASRLRKLQQNSAEKDQTKPQATESTKQKVETNRVEKPRHKRSQSVPPEFFRRSRSYPQPLVRNISKPIHALNDVSNSDEEEASLSPRRKDFRLISEIDQKFSQVVRQLKSKTGKLMDSAVLIAVQFVQNLPLMEKNYQFALSDSYAIVHLLNLLLYEDVRIRLAAADVLAHLSENPHLQLEICDVEGLQIILSIIQTSNHIGLAALVAKILSKCAERSVVRERLLNSRSSLGILFSKVESCLIKENSAQRSILKQLLKVLYQISIAPSSHLRVHEYNPIRTYGLLLDNFYQFTDEMTTEEESSTLLIPIFGFIANICKESRNVKLVNQLKLSPKIYRTIVIHQDTEDKELRSVMAKTIGRISSKSNINLMIHTQILDILNKWLIRILNEESFSVTAASAVLYALTRCTKWDALLELYITEIALKDSNVLARIIALVSIRQDLQTMRSAMHALGLISNLSRHPSIATQMVEKGVISLVCSSTLTSSIPNFIIRSLEILMHICENKVTEEILKEMSSYGTFTLLPMLVENKHIPIQVGAMQTLCAMITDDRRADSVVKFGNTEYGLPPIIINILEGLAQDFNSTLETRALELDLGQLFDGVMQLIKKLLLSELNLRFFGDPVVIRLILQCMTAEREEVQPSNFAFSCSVLSHVCKEVPSTVDIIYESTVIKTVIRFLKRLSTQPFKKNAKENEEYEFSSIGILNLLTVLCRYEKCVIQLCIQNPIDMFLGFLDSQNELIQELTAEVLSLMRETLKKQ